MANRKNRDQKIIEAAVELIARQSYHGTAVKHITDKLEMTKLAVYSHFVSKTEIVH